MANRLYVPRLRVKVNLRKRVPREQTLHQRHRYAELCHLQCPFHQRRTVIRNAVQTRTRQVVIQSRQRRSVFLATLRLNRGSQHLLASDEMKHYRQCRSVFLCRYTILRREVKQCLLFALRRYIPHPFLHCLTAPFTREQLHQLFLLTAQRFQRHFQTPAVRGSVLYLAA